MALPFFRAIERFFHRRFARIACVSDESAAALERWLGKRNFHASVIPNGIATRQFSASVPPAPDIKAWVGTRTALVMTARLVPAKDHVTALGALAFLPEDFCLILVGDGPERRALGAMAMRLGLGRRCLFAGTRKDVPEVLACASIYLQSSRVEGFGIAALEAMAAGLPVVASDAPGLGELVRGAGEIFRVGDAEACAAAIRMLASDTGAMARAKAVGRLRAQEFSIDACAARYARLYLECLEDAR